MARSPYQSDLVVRKHAPPPAEHPEQAGPVTLPVATLRSSEASARATRWVMILTFLALAALAVLTLVGPHIPSGE